MSEWWSYRPADFLMFSPRIYWRLFASINEAFWPAQPALLAVLRLPAHDACQEGHNLIATNLRLLGPRDAALSKRLI